MTTLKRRSSLGQARGDGAAGQGSHHWMRQRMTSVALVLLGLWFFYGNATHDLSSYEQVVSWLQTPFNFALMALTLLIGFYHAFLGLQVVIEDYVHHEGVKFISFVSLKLLFAFLSLASLYSLIKIQWMPVVPSVSKASLLSTVEVMV